MSTNENLAAAFAGESQASRKYMAFAAQADKDGLPQIAKLFRAAAEAETIHAVSHLRVMGGIKKTVENLQAAMDGEHHEFTSMYPGFLDAARAENATAAVNTFTLANEVEKVHYKLYSQAMDAAKSGSDLPAAGIYVCAICGHTHTGDAPEFCPVCKAKGKYAEVK